MTTFSLEACQRLAEVLGEENPRREPFDFLWCKDTIDNESYVITRGEFESADYFDPQREDILAGAYRLDDLTKEVWEKIKERARPDSSYAYLAADLFEEWFYNGYKGASKYLIDILQGYGNQTKAR